MGMAASQARYLSLTARKTNVEYQGQQVNQERTALANQSAGLVNQMLNLSVPTPPSATDFTTTNYVFTDPSSSNVLTIDSIIPYAEQPGANVTYADIWVSEKSTVNYSHVIEREYDGYITENTEKDTYELSIGGKVCTVYGPAQMDSLTPTFQEAFRESGKTAPSEPKTSDYYLRYTYNNVEYYINVGTINPDIYDPSNVNPNDPKYVTYSLQSSGKTNVHHYEGVTLNKANDGTGRYESITYEDEQGKSITLSVTQQTVQDDEAYDAAMETYNAEKAIYEKTVSEINAKTEIIQQQDRKLELHLDQLDTEQQAIQTEMEAIKKVIDKNIDETFKTFA